MKHQDILFIIVLLGLLLLKRNPKLFVGAGLLCIVLSMPLFALHVFFTAQHLTYYAGGFLLISIILFLVDSFKNKVN